MGSRGGFSDSGHLRCDRARSAEAHCEKVEGGKHWTPRAAGAVGTTYPQRLSFREDQTNEPHCSRGREGVFWWVNRRRRMSLFVRDEAVVVLLLPVHMGSAVTVRCHESKQSAWTKATAFANEGWRYTVRLDGWRRWLVVAREGRRCKNCSTWSR